jgi:hypothetical protein
MRANTHLYCASDDDALFSLSLKQHRNIVATVNLDCKLDLKTIAFHARNVEYNPKV